MRLAARFWCGLAVILLTCVGSATADPWNERTILRIDEPVMVPGATLKPGTYVFQIADAVNARHMIRIIRQDDDRVVTTVQAVPMHRTDATPDIVLTFEPTGRGEAPALKGWFYPGRLYGHEFVYPEDQARTIAARTHTLVLSADAESSVSGKGTLHVIDAQGTRADWRGDEALNREWESWNRGRTRQSASSGQASVRTAPAASQAALAQADFQGMRVKLDELEDNPSRYIGKRVSVDGEVDQILGPRIFKIDEPGWIDLEGEYLVVLPAGAAALLKEYDQVTVSGTVRQFVRADVERDWGWLNDNPELELKLARKPVIVADRIIGTNDQRTLIVGSRQSADAVGTAGTTGGDAVATDRADTSSSAPNAASGDGRAAAGVGAAAQAPVTDAIAIASADDEMVGRPVHLDQVKVTGVDAGHGFFVGPRERQIFVLAQYAAGQGHQPSVSTGQNVSIDGFVMQMPGAVPSTLSAPGALNKHVYVYATEVK